MDTKSKFEIGQRVKLLRDENSFNRYIIISTKLQKLDKDFLTSKSGKFTILNFEKMADNEIETKGNFDYLICKEEEYLNNGKCELVGEFISVYEQEIEV